MSGRGGDPLAELWARYGAYLATPPEQSLEWTDRRTGARGWLILNSLRGGAAGGGTRMRPGLGHEEVVYLAKTMELKFAFSGPPIGGGKSGIDFDPGDPRARAVLERWYDAVRPILAERYGTGGDVGVDEQGDVVPACAELGLVHPQQGILVGHLGLEGAALQRTAGALREGIRRILPDELGVAGADLTVSDMVTGWGVARATARLHERTGRSLDGARVVVEGFGNVGGSAALYLARAGARIVGLVDRTAAVTEPDGLEAPDVEELLRRRTSRELPAHPRRVEGPEREFAYRAEFELFVPASVSGTIDGRRLSQLHRHGVETIVCGANQPFAERVRGETVAARAADLQFAVLADMVASQGMAAAFHHLMRHPDQGSAQAVFEAVGRSVEQAVDRVLERAPRSPRGLMAAALDIALEEAGVTGRAPDIRPPPEGPVGPAPA